MTLALMGEPSDWLSTHLSTNRVGPRTIDIDASPAGSVAGRDSQWHPDMKSLLLADERSIRFCIRNQRWNCAGFFSIHSGSCYGARIS